MTRIEETACDRLWRAKLDQTGSTSRSITTVAISLSALLVMLAVGL